MRSLTDRVIHDPRFRRDWHAVRVMAWCEGHLDWIDPRQVKGWVLARELRVERGSVYRALARLTRAGYLAATSDGPHDPTRRYRLSRPPHADAAA